MIYRGHVVQGAIVLDEPAALPEGAAVEVRLAAPPAESERSVTLYEQLLPFIGKMGGLPSDMAAQHDHYLYGSPRRP